MFDKYLMTIKAVSIKFLMATNEVDTSLTLDFQHRVVTGYEYLTGRIIMSF